MGLWHAFSSTEKEKTMLNEKEFYQYVEANILNYLPEMEGKKVMVQRVKRNNQISMMGLSIGETKNYLVPVLYLEIFYRNLFKGTGIIRYDERYRQNLSRTSGWILSG